MDARSLFDALERRFGDAVHDFTTDGTKDPYFRVRADRWLEVAATLRDDREFAFEFLQNLTAVDWIKQAELEVVYHLWSYAQKHGCVVKIALPNNALTSAQQSAVTTLKAHNIPIVELANPYLHAKAIVIDSVRAYVGSENFTDNSLNMNRELGLIIGAPSEVAKVQTTVRADFAAGTAL